MSELILNRGVGSPTKCRSCGARVVFAATATGKSSPFEEDAEGVWVLENGKARHVGKGTAQLELGAPAPQHYTSHFATEHAELRGKYDAAVEELRELRRERDPERIERELDARVARAVAATVVKLANAKGQIAELESEVRELREGKRRLRDALERAKAGRS